MSLRSFFFLGCFLILSLTAYPQFLKPSKVPAVPKAAFDSLFPGIKNVIWKKIQLYNHPESKYEATFTFHEKRMWITFNDSGSVLVAERALDKERLPDYVFDYKQNHHRFATISDAREVFLSDRKFILVVVVRDGIFHSMLFKEDGTCIKDESNLADLILSSVGSGFLFGASGSELFKPFKIKDGIYSEPDINYDSTK